MIRPMLIGITGGTGSGKSTVAKEIYGSVPVENIAVIEQDSYYKDQGHLTFEERIKTNYDHPNAFDIELILKHLRMLLNGDSIEKPVYDFEIHSRKKETVRVEPKSIIILEGIMILAESEIRDMLDIKIFVDTDSDLRIIRRIQRDISERGRTVESVINQYMSVVRPMHLEFVEPMKRYADIIIPEGGHNRVAIDMMIARVKEIAMSRVE
jgi:uridine kinase